MSCDWPIDESCLPALPETTSDDPAYDVAVASLEAATSLASQVLWALSGRQYGICPDVARPCPQRYPCAPENFWQYAYDVYALSGASWYSLGCDCSGSCTLTGPRMVHLPGPVVEITAVIVAGVELADTDYILEGDVLYGTEPWPSQDMSKPAGEPGTWTVEYTRGIEPPPGVGKLTSLLATEFYNACTGGKCRLPRTVSEISRQGVTHRIVNPSEIYAMGKTGIPEIDLWLAAVNPHHLMSAPSVM